MLTGNFIKKYEKAIGNSTNKKLNESRKRPVKYKNRKLTEKLTNSKKRNRKLKEGLGIPELDSALWDYVFDYVITQLENIECTNLSCYEVEEKVHGYDSDYCNDDGNNEIASLMYEAQEEYAKALTANLLWNLIEDDRGWG